MLQGGLDEQADRLLHRDDRLGVAVRDPVGVAGWAASRAEAVAHPRIHEVHDQDVDDLAPPPQAPAHPHVVLFLDRNLPHTARQLAKNRWPHKHQVVDLRTVTVGDVELNLAEAGVGGRPFLLLHGFTGAKEDFTDYVDRLAEQGWHVVAPDHRGHGDSAKPDDEAAYGFSVFASDALGLADALGWDQFVVLGHSMGGMVLQYMLSKAPERLAAVVLMDTAHGPLDAIPRDQAALAIAVVRERGIDGLADLMADRENLLESPAHKRLLAERPGYAEFGDRKLRAASPQMYVAMVQELLDQEERLGELEGAERRPTLVIVGEQDQAFLKPSARMAEALGGDLAVIPDAGHSPQFENPEGWWDALDGFLGGLVDS